VISGQISEDQAVLYILDESAQQLLVVWKATDAPVAFPKKIRAQVQQYQDKIAAIQAGGPVMLGYIPEKGSVHAAIAELGFGDDIVFQASGPDVIPWVQQGLPSAQRPVASYRIFAPIDLKSLRAESGEILLHGDGMVTGQFTASVPEWTKSGTVTFSVSEQANLSLSGDLPLIPKDGLLQKIYPQRATVFNRVSVGKKTNVVDPYDIVLSADVVAGGHVAKFVLDPDHAQIFLYGDGIGHAFFDILAQLDPTRKIAHAPDWVLNKMVLQWRPQKPNKISLLAGQAKVLEILSFPVAGEIYQGQYSFIGEYQDVNLAKFGLLTVKDSNLLLSILRQPHIHAGAIQADRAEILGQNFPLAGVISGRMLRAPFALPMAKKGATKLDGALQIFIENGNQFGVSWRAERALSLKNTMDQTAKTLLETHIDAGAMAAQAVQRSWVDSYAVLYGLSQAFVGYLVHSDQREHIDDFDKALAALNAHIQKISHAKCITDKCIAKESRLAILQTVYNGLQEKSARISQLSADAAAQVGLNVIAQLDRQAKKSIQSSASISYSFAQDLKRGYWHPEVQSVTANLQSHTAAAHTELNILLVPTDKAITAAAQKKKQPVDLRPIPVRIWIARDTGLVQVSIPPTYIENSENGGKTEKKLKAHASLCAFQKKGGYEYDVLPINPCNEPAYPHQMAGKLNLRKVMNYIAEKRRNLLNDPPKGQFGPWKKMPRGGIAITTFGDEGQYWSINRYGYVYAEQVKTRVKPERVRYITGNGRILWALGLTPKTVDGYPVLKWSSTYQKWQETGLYAMQISAGPMHQLALVTARQQGKIYSFGAKENVIENLPGRVQKISYGMDGKVWALTDQQTESGYRIRLWADGEWQPAVGAAVDIAAQKDGYVWGVQKSGRLFMTNGSVIIPQPGWAQYVQIVRKPSGAEQVFIFGRHKTTQGRPIYKNMRASADHDWSGINMMDFLKITKTETPIASSKPESADVSSPEVAPVPPPVGE
jgi:hypothetical protein